MTKSILNTLVKSDFLIHAHFPKKQVKLEFVSKSLTFASAMEVV